MAKEKAPSNVSKNSGGGILSKHNLFEAWKHMPNPPPPQKIEKRFYECETCESGCEEMWWGGGGGNEMTETRSQSPVSVLERGFRPEGREGEGGC